MTPGKTLSMIQRAMRVSAGGGGGGGGGRAEVEVEVEVEGGNDSGGDNDGILLSSPNNC